ncbi:MAG TPA: hypothetical protein VHD37_00405 [Candidatus Paceibacterota bacterium]|nr:hypothetical protein [Candidatus Paceibacterota bacterium]
MQSFPNSFRCGSNPTHDIVIAEGKFEMGASVPVYPPRVKRIQINRAVELAGVCRRSFENSSADLNKHLAQLGKHLNEIGKDAELEIQKYLRLALPAQGVIPRTLRQEHLRLLELSSRGCQPSLRNRVETFVGFLADFQEHRSQYVLLVA